MRMFLIGWTLCLVPLLVGAQSPLQRLDALAPGEWLSYEVPLQPGTRAPCCFAWSGRDPRAAACRLDREPGNFGTSDSDPAPPAGTPLRVLVRRGEQGADRLLALGAHCALDPGGAQVVAGGSATAADSVALLQRSLAGRSKPREHAVMAIAYHAGTEADDALREASQAGTPRELRRTAIFWLAQARGEPGFRAVRALLESEQDDELRRHAVFALSQSPVLAAAGELRRLATSHAEPDVRGEALFWLAQNDDPEVEALIAQAIGRERASKVLEKAIFALSQLPAERAIPALRQLVEQGRTREVRKHALFWLAQVDDDAVLPVFDRLLGGDTRRE